MNHAHLVLGVADYFSDFLQGILPASAINDKEGDIYRLFHDEGMAFGPAWNDSLEYESCSDEGKAHVVETLNAAHDYLAAHISE